MTKIKICGITNLEDALFAASLGADELGFNFYKGSPRYIEPEVAGEIVRQLPQTTRAVGVFVNETPRRIFEIVRTASLSAVQLHGDESAEVVRELQTAAGLFVIKSFRVLEDLDPYEIASFGADAIMLDSFSVGQRGGTGETFDWGVAKKMAGTAERLYLAGGLAPENVADAIKFVGPYAVDACSHLESAPGKKEEEKIRGFISQVRECR